MVLIEVLITLAAILVMVTVALLVWATWFKRAEPVVPTPREVATLEELLDPPVTLGTSWGHSSVSTLGAVSTTLDDLFGPEVEPEGPSFQGELPPAIQIVQRVGAAEVTTLYIRGSDGTWAGGVPEGGTMPTSFHESQVRILLGTGSATAITSENLREIMEGLNDSMRALTRDFSRLSLERFSRSVDQMFTNVTVRRTTRTVAPQVPASAPELETPKKKSKQKVAPPADKDGPSRIDRLLSDDDVV